MCDANENKAIYKNRYKINTVLLEKCASNCKQKISVTN